MRYMKLAKCGAGEGIENGGTDVGDSSVVPIERGGND